MALGPEARSDTSNALDVAEKSMPATRRSAPGGVIWLLIVLAAVVGMGATLNSWVDRQALDTQQWVSVSDDMLANDDVRDALSRYLVAELFATVDVAGELESVLPDATAPLAGPLAASLRANAVGLVDRLLATEQFGSLWTSVNQTAHTAFVRVARDDDTGVLSSSDGAFVVDLRELIVRVGERLGLPDTVGDRIPADAGQLTVFESNEINALQQAVRVVDAMSLYLFVLVVVLFAAAVYLARDRRVALRNSGCAIVVASALLLVAQRVAIGVGVDQLASAQSGRAAVGAIANIVTGLLNELAWAWLAMGVVIVAYSLLIGPSRAATAVRGFLAPAMSHPVGAWAVALGALGMYIVFAPGFNTERWIPALIFVGLFISAVELLRRRITREHPPTVTHTEL